VECARVNGRIGLDKFVIMPNHVHGIVVIKSVVAATQSVLVNTGLLSRVINGYKNVVTKEIRNNFDCKDFGWHRSFYDHIIRDERSLVMIRRYIENNPKMCG
jgi:REP element-mobilizing transposase RayT